MYKIDTNLQPDSYVISDHRVEGTGRDSRGVSELRSCLAP